MTIAKVRNLSKFGVITDVDPYNLPPEAWSMAVNVRFKQGSVERAPVFRRVPVTLSQTGPRFLSTATPTSGFDSIYIGYLNGRVSSYKSGVETDLSVTAYVNTNAEVPFTACHLGDVQYVNRSDRVPWSFKTSDIIFHTLTNWNALWTAKILRSCNSSLCAFGITESGTTYPSKIRTSNPAQVNSVPTSWDETDPTQNAYANIIGEMEGGITEAQTLGDIMIVYGLTEAWRMVPTATSDIWEVKRIFDDAGCLGVNCSVEVDKKHYVFGLNDIWMHDGVSKQSICDGVTRRSIFASLNMQKASRFFVQYDKTRKEIRCNYVASDRLTAFTGAEGCNRSAVYYIPEGTWTFDDLPFVFGSTSANLDTTLTWASVTQTYDTIGGTWLDQEDSLKKTAVMLGDANTSYSLSLSLYALDDAGPTSNISFPVDTNATRFVTLEKDGMDLDDLPEVEKLEGYKVISSIFPQARLEVGAAQLQFSFGASINYNDAPTYLPVQGYDGDTLTRCDFNDGGRYLFMKITHVDYHFFKLTGYDLDMYQLGDR